MATGHRRRQHEHAGHARDVLQGRTLGASTMARVQAESAFRADMAAAKKDIAAARAKGLLPNSDCAKEAAALSQSVPGAL